MKHEFCTLLLTGFQIGHILGNLTDAWTIWDQIHSIPGSGFTALSLSYDPLYKKSCSLTDTKGKSAKKERQSWPPCKTTLQIFKCSRRVQKGLIKGFIALLEGPKEGWPTVKYGQTKLSLRWFQSLNYTVCKSNLKWSLLNFEKYWQHYNDNIILHLWW